MIWDSKKDIYYHLGVYHVGYILRKMSRKELLKHLSEHYTPREGYTWFLFRKYVRFILD